MTQKTQTAYNQWFNEQIHLLSDLTDSLHETEDPHKKLVIYDDVIERAKKFVRKCKKHEKAKNLSLSRLQEAEKELYFYEGIKQRYLDDYFEKELETVVDEKSRQFFFIGNFVSIKQKRPAGMHGVYDDETCGG